MDKLKAMQVFMQIAEHGSLTAAARALDSSLPAVVRTLAALEVELNVRLFNRTTRRISLTEEGKKYLASCRLILSALVDAEAALTEGAQDPSGHLTITAPVLFGQMFVAPAVTRFVQRYAKMKCSVVLLDRVVNLLEEGIDVGIRIGALADSSLIAQPLGSIRRVVVVSPAYLRKNGTPKHPHDLVKHNCVRFFGSSADWWTFRDNERSFNVSIDGNLDFNQAAAAVDACVAGVGIGMFISYQVAPYLNNNKLKVVLQKYELAPHPVHVIYPHARLLPARTRLFIEWINQEIVI
ncbi:MAG: transcriptional regulator, LysR family [Verrucomicrobiaceae bacterium]|nr:transcriptional regulator, LysR family [Verrucomicrobiaceae bacterium]